MNRKVPVTFQVPFREDERAGNGELHPPTRWAELQREMEERFDGFTNQPNWEGSWRRPDTGGLVREGSRVFQFDVEETRLDDARAFLRRVCVTFGQHSIRAIIQGYAESIEGGPDDEPL